MKVVIQDAVWRLTYLPLIAGALCAIGSAATAEEQLASSNPRFRIENPDIVLTDVPVSGVKIVALRPDGEIDTSYDNKRPLIVGIMFTVRDPKSGAERDTALPPFKRGVLDLKTDLRLGHKVYVTGSEIVVDPESEQRAVKTIYRTLRWFAIVPPLLAVILAVWLRNVLIALFAAIWSGAIILSKGDFFVGFLRTLDSYVVGEIANADSGGAYPHLLIILFTTFLGAMIGVMANSGGTEAIVRSLSRFTKTREQGQVATWGMGFLIFFDDYANSLLVGGTMRPVTDRLRISREKLAFLVDSTAAPVAGLALISTWVGYEVGVIQKTYEHLFRESTVEWSAYSTFLSTLPFRFYPLNLLVFVLLIAYIGRDFGPMLRAEARALKFGQLSRPDAAVEGGSEPIRQSHVESRIWAAVVPLLVLVLLIVIGLWSTGVSGLEKTNSDREQANADRKQAVTELKTAQTRLKTATDKLAKAKVEFTSTNAEATRTNTELARSKAALAAARVRLATIEVQTATNDTEQGTIRVEKSAEEKPQIEINLWTILGNADSNRVMFLSAFLASITAVIVAVAGRAMTLQEAVNAWASGAKSMFIPLVVLVLAWAVATLCDSDHLNTANFLVEIAGGRVSVTWVPALAFILSAVVAFATGSSFTTMGLLMPLFISMTYSLLSIDNDARPDHELMLATIGAVLAGAIFGDHCSPISDTTVLSSAATGCDHLDHVTTQMPYAVAVAVVSLVFGYIPVGFGFQPLIMLGLGLLAMFCIVQFLGRPVEAFAEEMPGTATPPESPSAPARKEAGEKDENDGAPQPPPPDENLDDMDIDWNSLPGN